jgi:uncharacterized protein YbjT (DUF2867 family)
MPKQTSLLILGATGLVGYQALQMALADDRIAMVIAPTRRPLTPHPKLKNPIVNFSDLADADWWKVDALICALGTTIKQAGSQAAFRAVDYQYVLEAAILAKSAGCSTFVLNSSLGADPNASNFYLKVKGQIEKELQLLGFKSLTLVRPSLLDGGPRPERRYGEEIGLWFGKHLRPLIPARYRPVTTGNVAKAMLAAALDSEPGMHFMESDKLQSYSMGKS